MSKYGLNPDNAGTYWDDLRVMLKKLRLICGYSHTDVAKALRISRPTYTYYERGKTVPDVVMLIALAKIYKIPPECFLHPEEFTDLKTARKRPPKKITVDLKSLGELSSEERQIIAEYRLREGKMHRKSSSG